jgi:uncharacterized protein YprB with RNaseH-like and TPR domain
MLSRRRLVRRLAAMLGDAAHSANAAPSTSVLRTPSVARTVMSVEPPPTQEAEAPPSVGTLSAPGEFGDVTLVGEEWTGSSGTCWVVQIPPPDDLMKIRERFIPTLEGPPAPRAHLWPESWRVPRLAVLDIETCGFSALPMFLIGILTIDADEIRLTQVLARDYSEEAALLEWTGEMLSECGGIVSFNGKSFDMRYIRDRTTYHRLPPIDEPPHADLLHISRRIWGKELDNCRLQTLETELCGRPRKGDIPGIAIPHVYHEFVRTGDSSDLAVVARHNRLDVITLAELFARAWHRIYKQENHDHSDHDATTTRI